LKETIFEKYEFLSIVSGIEDTVAYGDLLSYNLNLAGNSVETSHLKHDKNLQIKTLHDNNIPAPKNISLDLNPVDKKQIVNISKTLDYPIIVKPSLNGSSSIGVKKCTNKQEFLEYFAKDSIASTFKKSFSNFCIQEFLDGNEIVIDTISHNGRHYLTSCWVYTKHHINNIPVYRSARCLSLLDDITLKSFEYTKRVLDAIDYKNGFAHTELILSPEPKLIEVNPRTSGVFGAFNNDTSALGYIHQASKYCQLLLDKELASPQCNPTANREVYFFYNFSNYTKTEFECFISSITNTEILIINENAIVTDTISLSDCYAILLINTDSKNLTNEIMLKINNFEKGNNNA